MNGRIPRALAAAGVAAVALVPVLAPEGAVSQTAGQVLEAARPPVADAERAPLAGAQIPPAGAPALADPDAAAFPLREVAIEGATLYDEETLAALVADRIGADATPAVVAGLAAEVEAFHRAQGYIFTRVAALASEPEAGRVRLRVVEARIDAVAIEEPSGDVGPIRELVARLAQPLVGLENPRLADLERVLLLLNDVPGLTQATAIPRAGAGGAGSIAIVLNIARDTLGGVAFADTRQQPAFGEGLVGAVLEYRAWTASGDSTALTATNSFWDEARDVRERSIVQLEHARYVGALGTRIGGRALYSRSEPGAELSPLNLDGNETELEAWVEHPVVRTRPLSVWLRAGFTARESELEVSGAASRLSDDSLRVLALEARALARDPFGFTYATIGLAQGLGVLEASQRGDPNLSRSDADPQASVVFATAEREQGLTDNVFLFAEVAGQYASDPLLAAEEFAVGGTGFGRGFDPSETLGDHGVGATAELRVRDAFDVQGVSGEGTLYAFYDYGRIWNRGGGRPESDEISSFGFGARTAFPSGLQLGAELAKPLGALKRNGSDAPRVFFSAQMQF